MGQLNLPPLPVASVHRQPVTMRDGTVLRAHVHRPDDGERHRTVLVRSPYGEQTFRSFPLVPALEAGLAVVFQHCRGRGDSDGEFTPWVDEGRDGADTVDWVTSQPWSNGEVVGFGMSYLAGCALQLASERPGALKAIVATMTPHDFYEGLKYNGGAFAVGSAFHWSALQGMLGALHDLRAGDPDALGRLLEQLPLIGETPSPTEDHPLPDARVAKNFPFWREWVEHPERDAYWEGLAGTLRHENIDVPVLHTAGWFDVFLKGTLENHKRVGGRLIVGPWTHLDQGASAGEIYFGSSAASRFSGLEQAQLAFLTGQQDGPTVRIFVMGANVWRDEESWPPARAVPTRFHLHPDGVLSQEDPSADARPSRFPHDPENPVPTRGGGLLLPDPLDVGPRDQREVERHPGVLCFTSEPLARDLEVTGELTATLHGATTAPGADWTVKLVDVHPDGRAMNVADGIVRSPASALIHEVDLVATSQVFLAGHRIRVEVAGSNYPRFDRHPALEKAEQTLFHDAERPSWITLPVIP
ncbi:CocE/NonD family hydrolase [Actinocorallia sp. B10E7]|uniref:CocE/NonD family hydrolase n=1 Tax=Actinocorallia sp. B10E7 TaxID=3153558 RepID=UPI00325DE8C8